MASVPYLVDGSLNDLDEELNQSSTLMHDNNSKYKKEIDDNAAAGTSCSFEEDMPIDPNEPTFCICKQISFGKMIACDNPDCAIEWFHFECVSIITAPKGKWFCANCKKDKKKK